MLVRFLVAAYFFYFARVEFLQLLTYITHLLFSCMLQQLFLLQ